jgi:hypothetical protein
VVIGELVHLLKIWLDDQAQRHIPVSQAIISAKAKSLYYGLKKQMGDSDKDEPLFSASSGLFNRFIRRASLQTFNCTGEAASADIDAASTFPAEFTKLFE